MSENPDIGSEVYNNMIPDQGDLRFVERVIDNHGTPKKVRILQRYEWTYTKGAFDWYDVPLVEKE